MKRLKLRNAYHDALIRAIRYNGDDVAIDVHLCSCCNPSPGPATLYLFGMRNVGHVQSALEQARQTNRERDYIDEIIGITRHPQRGVVFDLSTAGALHFDSRGLHET